MTQKKVKKKLKGISERFMGRKLQNIREKKKWSIAHMAQQCRMNVSNYRRIELGRWQPSVAVLQRILGYLEISWKDFWEGK